MRLALFILLLVTQPVRAQDLTVADLTLAGMQLGKNTLQDVISHFGIAPLRSGHVDEVCYRSESPLVASWVLFGAGDEGDYEKLTQFRVVTAQPTDITCRPLPGSRRSSPPTAASASACRRKSSSRSWDHA